MKNCMMVGHSDRFYHKIRFRALQSFHFCVKILENIAAYPFKLHLSYCHTDFFVLSYVYSAQSIFPGGIELIDY